MKIAVLSDTHIGQRLSAFPKNFLKEISAFDAVIHCGDYATLDVAKSFQELKNFYGVFGNMDNADIHNALPEHLSVDFEGVRIGVIHGSGSPAGLTKKVYVALCSHYPKNMFDVIFFGHAHSPSDEVISGVRFINPGAFSGNNNSSFGSWGILTIENNSASWELKKISTRGF